MANYFWRKPTQGGDLNAWAPFNDAHIRQAIGEMSCDITSDATNIIIGGGRIGINDGVTEGVVVLDGSATLAHGSLGTGSWMYVCMTVSGTVPTFTLKSGAVGLASRIPAALTAFWDAAKRGYYKTATERIICAFYESATGPSRLIVCRNNQKGWVDVDNVQYINSTAYGRKQICTHVVEIGDWNMDASAELTVLLDPTITWGPGSPQVLSCDVVIRNDASLLYPLYRYDGTNMDGGIKEYGNYSVTLVRRAGGIFDGVAFDATSYNRGYVTVTYLSET